MKCIAAKLIRPPIHFEKVWGRYQKTGALVEQVLQLDQRWRGPNPGRRIRSSMASMMERTP